MTVSIHDAHAEQHAKFEGREAPYCIEQIEMATLVLQTAIAKLSAQADAFRDGMEAEQKDCNRAKRVLSSANMIVRIIDGDPSVLPRL
ncbi:MAG: hypothetical protein ACRC62_30040 [Microcoleus sp.]